jgi:catechol 2,3-dioxygenase-like lactoylglutathione lyase family enzyme
MSTPTSPVITGIHHIALTVTDLENSMNWYQELFQAERRPGHFPHFAREETGYAELLVDHGTGLFIGLHHHYANQGEKFDESRTGMDHISFQADGLTGLQAWVERLDALNIEHSGIQTRPGGSYSTVVFRDPDNNQLEFAANI